MKNTSLSIFARALASENISFSFDGKAATASFDVQNRHLVMPIWNVSETVQTMLVAHEISHALWTPYEQSEVLFKQADADGFNVELLQRICNVIEDVRIEKKMKDKFPGTRRDFFLGYKEINDLDLFGIGKMDLTEATIVNKINIHFKWGVPGFINVPMDEDEQGIVAFVDACETFEDAFNLAKILYQHPSMEQARKRMEDQEAQVQYEPGQGQPSEGVMNTDIPGPSRGSKDGERVHSPVIVIPETKNLSGSILSTDWLLERYEDHLKEGYPSVNMDNYRAFVKESDAFVRQLAMQFERRKAADEIRKERPKQTGQLNLDRLHQYRTHDDIFLSKIVKQDGKNHGIVFMLDLSGSMAHQLGDCFLQILQLVWFCEKVKIPFEVFGFTDISRAHLYPDEFEEWQKKNPGKYISDYYAAHAPEVIGQQANTLLIGEARLVNLASSRDNADKRERLLAFIYESTVQQSRYNPINLGGTPTVESLALASQFTKDWIKANNIQIPTIMLVTDGEPNSVAIRTTAEPQGVYHIGDMGTLTVQNNITGDISRMSAKDMTNSLPNEIIGLMLDSLREKFNARLVGMMVGPGRLSDGLFATYCLTKKERKSVPHNQVSSSPRFKAAAEAYKEGCVVLNEDIFHGYDAYFLTRTPQIVKDEDAIADSGTFTKVKNTFIRTMAKRSGSRVFLTRYVDIVAGQPLRKGASDMYSLSAAPAK
jgi:hypothetical protein